jgi:hypothetical protein
VLVPGTALGPIDAVPAAILAIVLV